jgi:hypothetical protein
MRMCTCIYVHMYNIIYSHEGPCAASLPCAKKRKCVFLCMLLLTNLCIFRCIYFLSVCNNSRHMYTCMHKCTYVCIQILPRIRAVSAHTDLCIFLCILHTHSQIISQQEQKDQTNCPKSDLDEINTCCFQKSSIN